MKSTNTLFFLLSVTLVAEEEFTSISTNNESNNQEILTPIENDINNIETTYTVNTPYNTSTIIETLNRTMYNEKLEIYPLEDDFISQDTTYDTNTPIDDNSVITTYYEEIENFPQEDTSTAQYLTQENSSLENTLSVSSYKNEIESFSKEDFPSQNTNFYNEKNNQTDFSTNNYDIDRQEEISQQYPSFPTSSTINSHPKTKESINKNSKLTPLSYASAISKARRENKIILLEVVSTNCKYCERMQNEVFSEQIVIDTINRDFVYMKMNGQKETLPLGLGLMGSPMHIFINKNEEKEIHRGFKSKDEFLSLLRKISS